ncbi:N-acetylneuraminate lyase-like isoform X2 [Ornithodoros turicata]|uniref:N-acetylneuraminate lyase-like isoform X2 n=1 Tax=Ornithodoros turicata TaxID=34597 RepID=UPI0031396D4C
MEGKFAKIQKYEGLCVAPVTPFDNNGHVNLEIIDKYVEVLRKQGITGAFVNGTTGEGLSLNVSERKKLAEKWIQAADGKLELLMIQVYADSLPDTQDLAHHAESIGADAIAVLPPIYYKCCNNDQLIEYLKNVSSAAPKTPLLYYHLPELTGVYLKFDDFLLAASKAVPTLCGAKYSSSDLKDLSGFLKRDRNHLKIFFGCDEILLCALALGVTAAIGGTFTYQGCVAKAVFDSFRKGDLTAARTHQLAVREGAGLISKYGHWLSGLKSTSCIVTSLDFGCTRSPVCPITSEKLKLLAEDVRDLALTIR